MEDGVLWLINKVVFHPRGFALGYVPETNQWTIQGDGREPWHFEPAIDDEYFSKVEDLLKLAQQLN